MKYQVKAHAIANGVILKPGQCLSEDEMGKALSCVPHLMKAGCLIQMVESVPAVPAAEAVAEPEPVEAPAPTERSKKKK